MTFPEEDFYPSLRRHICLYIIIFFQRKGMHPLYPCLCDALALGLGKSAS